MEAALPTRLQLEIVTPDRLVAHESVTAVTIPGKGGYMGILPGHSPLLSELKAGELGYTRDDVTHYVFVSWGFAEVLPARVIVLAEVAEHAQDIDVERAERARQRAEERLVKWTDPTIDMERARAALARALTRLQVARRVAG